MSVSLEAGGRRSRQWPLFHFQQCLLAVTFQACLSVFSQCCENSFHFLQTRGRMVSWQLHNFQKRERQRARRRGSRCAAVRTQMNFTPRSCLSSAAAKFGAAPWLLLATAWHGHTSQPIKHSGYKGTSAKHTCTILSWFHRYPWLLNFKRHEIMDLLLMSKEDNLGCIYFRAKFTLATETVLPSVFSKNF